ncbi:MAG: response regulator, partial [Spirochaetales bacterium]|nr:response regulator [Spirochaetales bacterium]
MIRVVVIDDEPFLLRNIKQSIEQADPDYRIVGEAYDGEEALHIIKTAKPDVIFTDIRMPVMDGLELITELKKNETEAEIIILSGYKEFDYAKKAMKLGVSDYLLKPINPVSLENLLSEIKMKLKAGKKSQQTLWLRNQVKYAAARRGHENDFLSLFGEYKYFHLFLLCIGPYHTVTGYSVGNPRFSDPDEIIGTTVSELIREDEDFWIADGAMSNERVLLFGSKAFSFQKGRLENLSFQLNTVLEEIIPPITVV